MKVAILHDYIKEYGGAERVLEALHEIWPESTVFTTVYLPEFLGPHKKRFINWDIRTSNFQNFPYIQKLVSPLRLFTPWIFENWDFSSFDLIFVSATGAYFPNLIVRKPHTLHICYCHTPPRYLYGYPTARDWQKNKLMKIIGGIVNHTLRQTDFIAAQRPDFFIANSIEVKRRIQKFYRRDAMVIYPPVDITKNKEQKTKNKIKKYYLAGGRLARAKRIDLAIEACNRLKLPLKIFGKGFADYDLELKKLAGPTIEFIGEVTDQELETVYDGAKALLYCSEFEDFGIIPVEVQSFGVPVIALKQGGVKETVIEGKTGVFFDDPTVESLIAAIKKFNRLSIKGIDCKKNAERFNKERFKRGIVNFVETKVKEQRTNNR